MAEYDALVNHVTLWYVAVERQIRVLGPDVESLASSLPVPRGASRGTCGCELRSGARWVSSRSAAG
jgi:hypothetical protein